jgi:hypothetical protein
MGYKTPPESARFKKGESGNTKGRPKKLPELDKLLSDIPESDYESVINKLFAMAKKGNVRAAEVILDRAYGKAKESLEVTEIQTIKSYTIVPASTRPQDSGQ